MKQLMMLIFLFSLLGTVGSTWQQPKAGSAPSSCAVVQNALETYYKLKVGMTRQALEQDFTPDGGFSTPWEAVYVYKQCHNIKVRSEFELDPKTKRVPGSAPSDKIAKLSKLYLDYESRD